MARADRSEVFEQLAEAGMSQREISATTGADRKTIRATTRAGVEEIPPDVDHERPYPETPEILPEAESGPVVVVDIVPEPPEPPVKKNISGAGMTIAAQTEELEGLAKGLADPIEVSYSRGKGFELTRFGRYACGGGPVDHGTAREWLAGQPVRTPEPKPEPKPKKARNKEPKAARETTPQTPTERRLAELAEEHRQRRATADQIADAFGFTGWGGLDAVGDWYSHFPADAVGPVDNLEDAPPDPDPRPSELSDDFVYDCMTLIVDYAECCGRLPWTSRRRSSPYFAARHLEGMARVKDELLNSLWYGVRDLDDIDSSVFRAPGEES